MTRHINLFDARLVPPRGLPAWWLPGLLAFALTLGGALHLAADWRNRALAAQSQSLQAELARLQAAASPGTDRSVVLTALRDQAALREQQVRQMQGLDGPGRDGGPAGPAPLAVSASANAPLAASVTPTAPLAASQWLQALSGVAIDGVWLTEIKVDADGALALEGRARSSARINAYLAHWHAAPDLAGTSLKLLEVRRSAEGDGALASGDQAMGFALGNAPGQAAGTSTDRAADADATGAH
jgi:Tfp pilus assembly protein PilN